MNNAVESALIGALAFAIVGVIMKTVYSYLDIWVGAQVGSLLLLFVVAFLTALYHWNFAEKRMKKRIRNIYCYDNLRFTIYGVVISALHEGKYIIFMLSKHGKLEENEKVRIVLAYNSDRQAMLV